MLLKAFKDLSKKESNYKLLLVGVIYDESYYKEMMDYIDRHQLSDRVQILTNLSFDSKKLAYAYVASDLFVLPSKYETFGIVILEAWAAGIPAICADIGGMRKFVKDGENSLFFDLESLHSLETKMVSLLQERSLYEKVLAGAQRDLKRYSWYEIAKEIETVYKEALK